MARIKLYEQGRLAPQAVGTPGISGAGETVSDLGASVLKETQKAIIAENAKIEIADNMEAENQRIQWENKWYNDLEKQRQDPNAVKDPYGLANSTFDLGKKSVDEYANSISNPRVRDKFIAKTQSSISSAQDYMRNWASDQTTTNAFVNLQEAITGITTQAGKVRGQAGFNGLLSQGEALIANAAPVIGTDKAFKLRQQLREDVASNFIYAHIDDSPGAVRSYIKSGMFDGILDEHQKLSLDKTAEAVTKRNIAEQHVATAMGNHMNINALRVAEAEGKLTVGQIDQMIKVAETNKYRKADIDKLYSMKIRLIKGESNRYAKKDNPEMIEVFTNGLGYITGFTQEGEVSVKGVKVAKGTTLERLQRSQDILDEHKYELTAKSAAKFQKVIDHGWMEYTAQNKYASKLHGNYFGLGKLYMDDYNKGLVRIQTYMDKHYTMSSDRKQAKAAAIQYYNKYYNQASKTKDFNNNDFTSYIIEKTNRGAGY